MWLSAIAYHIRVESVSGSHSVHNISRLAGSDKILFFGVGKMSSSVRNESNIAAECCKQC